MTEKRIVSLIASATEIVCALGFRDAMVGRSHECDFPPSVHELPVVTDPKFGTYGTSYEIDERVKAILQEGLSVYRVDAERLAGLRPDVIVTQDHCEVCAVSLNDVEAAAFAYLDYEPDVVSLHPDALSDIWADIRKVAGALSAPGRGAELVGRLQERIDAVGRRGREAEGRPRVACIEWIDPLMAAGNWMPELVEIAGGENLFGEAGGHSPGMTWEALVEADPDVVVVVPCGFDLERTREEMTALAGTDGWEDLRAVREGRVFLADGNQYFNRPGPRVVESLEILAELIHPELFDFGHRGTGWERL